MTNDVSLLGGLSIATLLAVLAIGIWQILKVRNSQRKRGEKPTGHPTDL